MVYVGLTRETLRGCSVDLKPHRLELQINQPQHEHQIPACTVRMNLNIIAPPCVANPSAVTNHHHVDLRRAFSLYTAIAACRVPLNADVDSILAASQSVAAAPLQGAAHG